MPYYLTQASYSPEGWSSLVENPEDRSKALAQAVEHAGGTFHGSWLSYGDYDVLFLYELPDNVRVASLVMAAGATEALRALKTTPLLTWEEGLEALRGASGAGYRAPGR